MKMEIRFAGNKKVQAHFNNYNIITDQPVAEGGSGSASSPFDLFLVSIGTCTGYYVLSFCQKNNIPTEEIHLTLNAEKNQQAHLIENINITIRIPSNFPQKYKKAVIKAAEACSVKRHLEQPPCINITMVDQ